MSSAKTVNKKKKKRNSQAPVALVYFITLLLFMGIIGGFAVYMLKQHNILGNDNSDNTPKAKYVSFTNLYARVTGNGVLADMAVIKFRPTDKKIIIVPISAYTVDSTQNNKTLRDVFAKGGVMKLRKAVEQNYNIKIDHYATITPSAFDSCLDIFGGFSYTPMEELYYLDKNSNAGDLSLDAQKTVTLSGRQIRLISSYPVFSAGRQENIKFLGTALTESLNNGFRQPSITSDNMDNFYSIITANSETDIDEDTFKYQRSYIRDMLKENITPCESIIPEGQWTDETHFKPSDDFKNKLKDKFAEKGSAVAESSSEDEIDKKVKQDLEVTTATNIAEPEE